VKKLKENTRILIVEDDEKMVKFYTVALGDKYNIEAALHPSVGYECFRNKKPDLLILDINLPGESGVELARRIREIEPELPIIFISGHPEVYRQQKLEIEGDDYIVKPIGIDELRLEIDNILFLSSMPRKKRIKRFEILNQLGDKNTVRLVSKKIDEDIEKVDCRLKEGEIISCVILEIPEREEKAGRIIASLANTIGCIGHCECCVSKDRKYVRGLTREELTGQLRVLLSCCHAKPFWDDDITILEIPLMCEGEPLTNLINIIGAIDHVLAIPELKGRVEFIISTIGLEKGLEYLYNNFHFNQTRMHWSLIYSDPRMRKKRMPGTRGQNISKVRDWFIKIAQKTGKQVIVNYVLMKGVNDLKKDIDQLINFLNPRYFEIKLSELVEEAGSKEKKVPFKRAMQIAQWLKEAGYSWHYFTAKGIRIGGACGQTIPNKIPNTSSDP